MELSTSSTILLIAAPLIVWRLYSRIRRLIGRQRSRPWRHWVAAILFPVLLLLIALSAWGAPLALAGLLAGVAIGIGLAVWGLRLTQFEKTAQGFFYTPNAHIGIALSLLLVARIGYRLFQVATLSGVAAQQASQNFTRSPGTTLIFGMLAGYYTWYAIGILRWRQSVNDAPVVPN
jgi:cytochrome b561